MQTVTNKLYNSYTKSYCLNRKNSFVNFTSEPNSNAKIEISDTESNSPDSNFIAGVTKASLAAACCVFVISKGFQNNSKKYLKKIKNFLETRQEHSLLSESSKRKNFYEFSIRKTNAIIKKSESINNIISIKDILFMKLMYKTKLTKNIHEKVTEFFENISRKKIESSYKKTKKDFAKMNKIFDELDEYILNTSADNIVEHKGKKYTHREFVNMAREHRKNVNDVINNFISEESIQTRYNYIKDATSTLSTKFWDASFKNFWSKDNKFKRKEMWQTFIADEQIKGDKTRLIKEIADVRKPITYTKTDRISLICDYIKKLDETISPNDKEGIEIIKKLEWYTKYSDDFQYNKAFFLKELTELEKHSNTAKINNNFDEIQDSCRKSYINAIRELMDTGKRGEMQDMLALYYKIVPYELTKSGGLFSVQKAVKSFDKSVNLESVEFFEKVRDLRLGSAPTDVLTVLVSMGVLVSGLKHAKDKDEKYSLVLKSGIPVTGAVATTLYTAAKLTANMKSLLFGVLSGVVLNQIGTVADNLRKTIHTKTHSDKLQH